MTDNTQELEEILDQLHVRGCELADQDSNALCSQFKDQAKQAILDWRNKQTERLLNEILVDVADPNANIDQAEMIELINLYINKLKGSTNE